MAALNTSPSGRYRICVNSSAWKENEGNEYERALALVSEEEQKRISKFYFRKDAKTALIGRLILNTMVSKAAKVRNSEIVWRRTDKGKPYLDQDWWDEVSEDTEFAPLSYNISHSGDWVVGACELNTPVGIDVNDYGIRPNCKIDFDADTDDDIDEHHKILKKYFVNFKQTFSPPEAEYMKKIQFDSAESQLIEFSRFWTLKESFVKVDGFGFSFDVSRLHFDFSRCPYKDIPRHPTSLNTTPISVIKDGTDVTHEWTFEQFTLDRNHLATVALHTVDKIHSSSLHPIPVTYLQPSDLITYLESTD